MGFVALAASVALAAVFAVSGVAKLLDRPGTREAVSGFGVPRPLVTPVATGLAPAELLVALLLVVPATRVTGLVLAVLLLVAFTTAVVLALRAGRRPECHCFGRIGGADVSGRTVTRNSALLVVALAGLAAAAADGSGGSAAGAAVVGVVVAAAVLAAEGLAGAAARRRREGEDEAAFQVVGAQTLPDFEAETLSGRTSRDQLLAPGLPLLLVTLSPGCGPCMKLRPDIARWAEVLRGRVTVAVLATSTVDSNRTAYAENPDLTVVLDSTELQEALGTTGAPSAVLLGPDGRATSGVAAGEKLVRQLLVTAATGRDVQDDESTGAGTDASSDQHDDEEQTMDADDLDLTSVVTPRPGVIQQVLEESTLVIDPRSGATVALDPTGALVWSVLDGRSRLDEIVADIADVYGVTAEVVGPDVLALVQSLGRAGLLVGVTPERAEGVPVAGSPHADAGHDHEGHDHAGNHGGHDHAGGVAAEDDDAEPARTS